MPASLGSAQFDLTVNGAALVSGLKQAESQAQASSQKIAQSLGQVDKSVGVTSGAFRGMAGYCCRSLVIVAASTAQAARASLIGAARGRSSQCQRRVPARGSTASSR